MSDSKIIALRPSARAARRNYSAVTTPLTPSWPSVSLTADQVIRQNLRVLRAKAREQIQNNDYAKRFIGMVKAHVVGPDGFVYQSRIQNRDGSLDTVANEVIEKAWKKQGRAENFDVAQQLSRNDLVRLWIATIAKDGEVLIRRRFGERFGAFGYSLQLIDPELLDVAYNDNLSDGRIIRMGIELDDLGRRQAYHFRGEPADPGAMYYGSGDRVRVPANEIWHHYLVEQVGQKRGVPWVATPLLRMHMLSTYEDAALVNARVGASKMGFYEQDPDASPVDPDAMATARVEDQLLDQVEPGVFATLPPGVKFSSFQADYPNGEFADFMKGSLRGIAAGLGVSYHKLANDLEGVNYSSGRLGELEDRELWKSLQNWAIEVFLGPLMDEWLRWSLRLGAINIGQATLKEQNFERYRTGYFQPRRWQWADPLKAGQANKLDLDNYLNSPQGIIRENGRDPDEVVADWTRWRDQLEQAGLPLPVMAGGQQNTTEEAGNPNAKEDD